MMTWFNLLGAVFVIASVLFGECTMSILGWFEGLRATRRVTDPLIYCQSTCRLIVALQARRDAAQARRNADQAQRDAEQARRDADQARRNEDQARRNEEQARRDADLANEDSRLRRK